MIKSQPIARHCPEFKLTSKVDIVLGGWGVASWTDAHLTDLIQPVLLRAPEVLIGTPWGPSVDLWNFGAMILETTQGKRMFSGKAPPDGKYDIRMHLREIEDMFGPFPKSFLDTGDQNIIRDCFDKHGKVKRFSNY
jgi:serine/threonine-protein kinase SRPK3